MMPVNAPTSSGMPEADLLGHVIDRHGAGDYAADLLAEAQVDDSWIEQKFPTVFNSQVAHNLKKSVYAI
ncbi:MAG: hypothetical protein JSS02_27140, partial [Planctomycetes bacterium]|nr:hypothetical protein [Planctomycetota bacterium]